MPTPQRSYSAAPLTKNVPRPAEPLSLGYTIIVASSSPFSAVLRFDCFGRLAHRSTMKCFSSAFLYEIMDACVPVCLPKRSFFGIVCGFLLILRYETHLLECYILSLWTLSTTTAVVRSQVVYASGGWMCGVKLSRSDGNSGACRARSCVFRFAGKQTHIGVYAAHPSDATMYIYA